MFSVIYNGSTLIFTEEETLIHIWFLHFTTSNFTYTVKNVQKSTQFLYYNYNVKLDDICDFFE